MKVFDMYGNELMEIRSLECRDGKLVARGVLMGAISTSAHVPPEQLWASLRLLSWTVLRNLPRLLWQGWARSRQHRAAA